MKRNSKKTALACAIAMGACAVGARATTITGGESATLDGWTVSAPTDVTVTLSDADGTLEITKNANFSSTIGGFLVTFEQSSASASPNIEVSSESLTNNTGSTWSGFQFLLLNSTSSTATFAGVGNIFVPPTGTGYDYSSGSLDSTKQLLTYTGTQNNGVTSPWGGTSASDDLLIDADPTGASPFQVFVLKELPEVGSGGSPVGTSTVPLPAASWESLIGLVGVGLLSRVKKARHHWA